MYLHKKLDENFEIIAKLEQHVVELENERDALKQERDELIKNFEERTRQTAQRHQRQIEDLQVSVRDDINSNFDAYSPTCRANWTV